jgi:hypothetical protein
VIARSKSIHAMRLPRSAAWTPPCPNYCSRCDNPPCAGARDQFRRYAP